ncbi:RNA binding protein [Dendrolimus punctatus cypovirus 22]|uniref:RNA binding protein n=1 Tax=Dendrolimus punctatus cypovirus 22 TaxID=1577776 RepID=UPI00053F9D95|nr:RNA binding protein [Dendrolimus punctatus cypovirus 22]AIY60607.1 RNA binding protein [Dendrolimus punctatus cypovirus 22]
MGSTYKVWKNDRSSFTLNCLTELNEYIRQNGKYITEELQQALPHFILDTKPHLQAKNCYALSWFNHGLGLCKIDGSDSAHPSQSAEIRKTLNYARQNNQGNISISRTGYGYNGSLIKIIDHTATVELLKYIQEGYTAGIKTVLEIYTGFDRTQVMKFDDPRLTTSRDFFFANQFLCAGKLVLSGLDDPDNVDPKSKPPATRAFIATAFNMSFSTLLLCHGIRPDIKKLYDSMKVSELMTYTMVGDGCFPNSPVTGLKLVNFLNQPGCQSGVFLKHGCGIIVDTTREIMTVNDISSRFEYSEAALEEEFAIPVNERAPSASVIVNPNPGLNLNQASTEPPNVDHRARLGEFASA